VALQFCNLCNFTFCWPGKSSTVLAMMIRVMERLQRWRGWRLWLAAWLAGGLSALGLPPFDLWPLAFAGFAALPVLLNGLDRQQRWASFRLGWGFGFGYFCVAFHWIGFAFLVDAQHYLWMMPFAIVGLAASMAIYWGLAVLLLQASGRRGLGQALALASAIAVAEALRGRLFTGFPWAAPGLMADGMGGLAQSASLWGMEGLTALVVLWATAWPLLFTPSSRRQRLGGLAIMALLPLTWGWGEARLRAHPTAFVPGMGLRLVQPNISQSDKWRSDNMDRIFADLLDMTAKPAAPGTVVTHIIWPESAVPFLLDESEAGREELAAALQPGQVVITGSLRREAAAAPGEEERVFNSILAVDSSGSVVARYDKWRLVPGGEFLPFESVLAPLGFRKVVELPGSFVAGQGPETVALPGAPAVGFSVCYEAIFPQRLVDPAQRPGWLVNVTNDGWFGRSTGPYQHVAQARLRSIEQGLPMARAANTGISTVIDSYGRSVAQLDLGTTAVLDAQLPAAAAPTLFAEVGSFMPAVVVMLLISLCLLV
jgi:apolipoprotein N-acyltransferase